MNRITLNHDIYYILMDKFRKSYPTLSPYRENILQHYQLAGWDLKWDYTAKRYTMPENQTAFFLLKYTA